MVLAQRASSHEIASVQASDGVEGDQFGSAMALSEDAQTLVVGAPLAGDRTGAVYVFTLRNGGWIEDAVLSASDANVGDQFGASVAIGGGNIVIGADQSDRAGLSSGSAYVFSRTDEGWVERAILHASDAALAREWR